MKIVAVEPAGIQNTYDLGIENTHNFILANGEIAHNCFNKCLDEDTLISTPYGYLPISKIQIGNYVHSYDITKQERVNVIVQDVINSGSQECFEITLENQTTIICTMNHQFLCADGIKRELQQILEENHSIIQNI